MLRDFSTSTEKNFFCSPLNSEIIFQLIIWKWISMATEKCCRQTLVGLWIDFYLLVNLNLCEWEIKIFLAGNIWTIKINIRTFFFRNDSKTASRPFHQLLFTSNIFFSFRISIDVHWILDYWIFYVKGWEYKICISYSALFQFPS